MYEHPQFHISASTTPSVRHYHIQVESYSVELDAYLLDFCLESQPDPICVVLVPSERDWPTFVYAPPEGLAGVADDQAIAKALAAYRASHPGIIPFRPLDV